MVLITGNALGSGLIWTLGHLDLFVKEIVEVWMETVIKKQHRGHSVGRRKTGKKAHFVQTEGVV